ncbi:MAG TPA: multicopper oxidase family protein, partial [Microbacterium sp.]|uniref:multicopper oxidase family protein n=1 Tax=Microbacterium sp. TaxID=51671 RepID=UPI002BE04905
AVRSRRDAAVPSRRDAAVAGAFAAAAAACAGEIVLTVGIGTPAGPAAAVAVLAVVVGAGVVTTLVRARRSGGSRRPVLAAAAAAGSIIAGAVVVGVVTMSGAGALQAAGFGPVAHGHVVHGHDGGAATAASGSPVPDLTSAPHTLPASGETVAVSLRAQRGEVELPSGRRVDAWTFGELAGPAIVARVGDTLDVSLTNDDIDSGATVHWHGYPVANAFDGVAGVTQDAVAPGGAFRAGIAMTQPGTYWYHTHQRGSEGVVRGLYGTLVVHPASGPTEDVDLTLPVHTFSGSVVIGSSDVIEERVVEPGDSVRLRLINTDQTPQTFAVQGAAFRVAAIDGTDVASAAAEDRSLVIPAGGRIDVVIEMPAAPVRIGVAGARSAGIGLVPHAGDDIPALTVPPLAFDALADLTPVGAAAHPEAATAIDAALAGAGFALERTFVLDRLPRIVQGLPNYAYAVDGRVYPFIEPTIVRPGDTVRLRFVNRSFETHPMHPHGHTVKVLSIDGRVPAEPLWLDTFDVGPGEVWEVALYADNPGIWMDHCHNLEHAALGMVTHLAYRDVTTPFEHGGAAGNAPE